MRSVTDYVGCDTASAGGRASKSCPGPRECVAAPFSRDTACVADGGIGRGFELVRLRRDAALRPPDWRARLASTIAGHPDRRVVAKLNTWADDMVKELTRLDRQSPDRLHPLAEARALLRPERRPVRVEIEARLLAGQDASEVAGAAAVRAEAVRWYHGAYYDCGDRLGAAGYITHTFLNSGMHPTGDPPLEVARLYGYHGGVVVLEAVLDAFRHWEADRRPVRGGTAAELARRARRLWARAAVMARSLSVADLDGAGVKTLLALAARPNRDAAGRGG